MTDIVERMRTWVRQPPRTLSDALMTEAADEIERLRAFAQWLIDEYAADRWPEQKDIIGWARAAIGAATGSAPAETIFNAPVVGDAVRDFTKIDAAKVGFCSQCGQYLSAPACGPTHASEWAAIDAAKEQT
jgi:hypothetical protein